MDLDTLVQRCHFPDAGSPLRCAVSGGADSLALLVLAVHAGCEVTAVHVDHQLRPNGDQEASVVRAAAERYGASFQSHRVSIADPGRNIEAQARAARRAVLGDNYATGHTADDQAETMLLAMMRGTGLDGLSPLRNPLRHPIVGLRRSETRALCEQAELPVVTDPSNSDLRFRRNRVRHEVIPLLNDVAERDVVPLLCRLAAIAGADSDALESLAKEALPDPTDASALAAAPEALAQRALRKWLRETIDIGGVEEQHPPSGAAVGRVLAGAKGEAVATEVSDGYSVRRSQQILRIEPT